jgi:hypothetical protein
MNQETNVIISGNKCCEETETGGRGEGKHPNSKKWASFLVTAVTNFIN